MRLMAKLAVFLFLSGAVALSLAAASAQAPAATPSPDQDGLIPAIVHISSDTASWLSGRAVEYAGSPLWQTLAGVMIIALIVSLYMWIRKPKKPTETRVPM
jgi:hypothetical protein